MNRKERPKNYQELQTIRSGGGMNSNTLLDDMQSAGISMSHDWSILDVGCRQGHILNTLFNYKYKNLYGFDIGDKAVELWSRLRFRDNLKKWDAHDPFPFKGPFDLITCSHVLEHCHTPEKVIENIMAVLKPGGYIHAIVPIEPFDDWKNYPYHQLRFDSHKEHVEFWVKCTGLNAVYEKQKSTNSIVILN